MRPRSNVKSLSVLSFPSSMIASLMLRFSEETNVVSPKTVRFPSMRASFLTVKPLLSTYNSSPTSNLCIGFKLDIPTLELVTKPVVGDLNSTVLLVVLPSITTFSKS